MDGDVSLRWRNQRSGLQRTRDEGLPRPAWLDGAWIGRLSLTTLRNSQGSSARYRCFTSGSSGASRAPCCVSWTCQSAERPRRPPSLRERKDTLPRMIHDGSRVMAHVRSKERLDIRDRRDVACLVTSGAFARWIALFHTTVDDLFARPTADHAKRSASRIALALQHHIATDPHVTLLIHHA